LAALLCYQRDKKRITNIVTNYRKNQKKFQILILFFLMLFRAKVSPKIFF